MHRLVSFVPKICPPNRSVPVLSMILKLFALRPLFSMAIFGIPVLTVLAIGLLAIVALKVLLFVVLPLLAVAGIVFWFMRRSKQPSVSP